MSNKNKRDERKTETRPPLDTFTKHWLFSGMIRNHVYFAKAVDLIKDEHFTGADTWLRLVWAEAVYYYRKFDEHLTKEILLVRCNAMLELNPNALTEEQEQELDEFITTTYEHTDEDWPEAAFMDALQKFLEDRLIAAVTTQLSYPQSPLNLVDHLSSFANRAEQIKALGQSPIPEGLNITCGPPDSGGRRHFRATYRNTHHSHRFDHLDQYHRGRFCEAVADKCRVSSDAVTQLEKLVWDAVESGTSGTAVVRNLADVDTVPVKWFWPGYIAFGSITLLEGDPDKNKSMIALYLAARNSQGDAQPPYAPGTGAHIPRDTVIIGGEDSVESTITPRLIAAGACLERIHFLDSVQGPDGQPRRVQLPLDISTVEDVLQNCRANFLIIDVLACVTEDGVSCNDDAAMRRLFAPLAQMAQRTHVAVLVLRHHIKKPGTSAMHRGGGSIGIIAAARSALAVATHPEDPDKRVLASVKNNLGVRPKSLVYWPEAVGDSARVVWGGEIKLTAEELLQASGAQEPKLDQAKAIILSMLANGPRAEVEVRAKCEAAGIGEKTIQRARKELGVQSKRSGFGGVGKWILSLSATSA